MLSGVRQTADRIGREMSESSLQKVRQKKDRTLTPHAFQSLLDWLDEGKDSGGYKYLEMRRRLVAYFDRKNCLIPDELTDETLNRVACRLAEEGVIETESPAKYCYTVARFVFMEHLRETQKCNKLRDALERGSHGNAASAFDADDDTEDKEKMLNCLEQCASKLEPLHREIITRYYSGTERVRIENRRALADKLGITINALSIRACRIRDKLEDCIRQCLGAK